MIPLHVFVQPDRQALERGVVRSPVGAPVAGLWLSGFTHAPKLPVRAPLGLCNKASPYYFNVPESTDFNKSKASLNCLSISK